MCLSHVFLANKVLIGFHAWKAQFQRAVSSVTAGNDWTTWFDTKVKKRWVFLLIDHFPRKKKHMPRNQYEGVNGAKLGCQQLRCNADWCPMPVFILTLGSIWDIEYIQSDFDLGGFNPRYGILREADDIQQTLHFAAFREAFSGKNHEEPQNCATPARLQLLDMERQQQEVAATANGQSRQVDMFAC